MPKSPGPLFGPSPPLPVCIIKGNMTSTVAFFAKCFFVKSFPLAQMVEHGASNAKIMGSIPRESKS